MDNKPIKDAGNEFPKTNPLETLEKLGYFATKIKEDEARRHQFAQPVCVPKYPMNIDTKAIRDAVAEYQPNTIIPDGYFEDTQEYQQKSLETLQSINENTANLYTMVELINKNNQNQEELLSIMSEILAIATAKDKKEAESLFKKVMQKINDTTDNVDTMLKVVGWATAVYNMVSSMLL